MISIDVEQGVVSLEENGQTSRYRLDTPEAFAIISDLWLRAGWDNKYVYSFTWLGRPIIQLPEDLIRIQEVIYSVQPDVVIETGVAHGGSLIFYASLCKAMGRGRVIGIDVEIRDHNRQAIEAHPLYPFISLIEGSSIDPNVVNKVATSLRSGERTIVMLDSCHTKEHVLAELNAYAPFVSVGSYIIAMDGIMESVAGAPRTKADWSWNNPRQAALDFVNSNEDFVIEEPEFLFSEGSISQRITYWPGGFIKRVASA
jgi:cephalosporin hydroxylase